MIALQSGSPRDFLERESARLIRFIVNSHPIVIWALDKDGVTTLSEGKALAALGLKPGQVVGRSVFEMYRGHPKILEDTRRALRGESFTTVTQVGDLTFESSFYPMTGPSGRPAGMFGVATDVTQLRRAQDELKRLQIEQREILDAVPAMIWYKDAFNRILRANRLAAQTKGMTVAQMEGRATEDLYPDEAAKYHKDDLDVIRKGRPKLGIVEPYELGDGTKRWVRTDKIPYRDPAGRVIGVIVFAQDITETRRTEESLRRKADLLGLLQAVSSASNLAGTSEEAMRVCLRRVCEATGWPLGHVYRVPSEGKGTMISTDLWHQAAAAPRFTRFRDLTGRIALSKGRGLPGRVWKSARPAWILDVRRDRNFPRRRAARASGIVSGFAFPVLVKNEVAAVLEFFTDRPVAPDTELLDVMGNIGTQLGRALERERAEATLRRSEQLFRHLVAGARDYALYMLDPDGRVASWNEGAERIKGYRAEEVIGRSFELFYPKEDVRRRRPQADLAAAAAEGRFEQEGWQLRKGGKRFWASAVITALRGEDGALVGFAHVTRDITERKRLEREILEAGTREQARIGRDLHDTLGQDLTGIALLANALRERLSARASPDADDAARIAVFASKAVRQAKDLARGLIPPELQSHGLSGGLRALAASARAMFGVDCEARCPSGSANAGAVAAVHLYRIAQEAIHNAVRHGRAKRISLTLAASRGRVLLTVADDGVGIKPSGQRREGLGLGIMQYRARMMGATLEVRRGARKGTRVVCSLAEEG